MPSAAVLTALSFLAGLQPLCPSSSYSGLSETLPERAGRKDLARVWLVEVDVLRRQGWLGRSCPSHCLPLECPDCIHLAGLQLSCPVADKDVCLGLTPVEGETSLPSIVTASKQCLILISTYSSCVHPWHRTQWQRASSPNH